MGTKVINNSEQIFLRWNNFENNLASGFVDLLQQEAMVDVTLAVEGRLVQAHKIVLSVCSSYFRNMFQVNPCQHPIVILKDVRYQELTDMLDFMYRGETSVKEQNLASFLKLAETLKVKGLASNSSESLSEGHQLDKECQEELPIVNVKQSATENRDGSRDINSRKTLPMFRQKRKRSVSPMKALDFKINSRNDKYDILNTYDDDRKRKHSYTHNNEGLNIKDERLSDASSDGYGEEVSENDFSESRLFINPSATDDSSENVQKSETSENELTESKLFPGPSRAEEFCETVPHENVISRRNSSKPLSLIWSFFNFDCEENKSECKLCGKVFKACPKTGTASVKYHLHFAHQILRNEGEYDSLEEHGTNYESDLKKSPVWKYFLVRREPPTMCCKVCLVRYRFVRSSAAERHLNMKHPFVYYRFRIQKQRWLKLKLLKNHVKRRRRRAMLVRKLPQRPPIWKFFINEGSFRRCKLCGVLLKGKYYSSAKWHMSGKHEDFYKAFLVEKKEWSDMRNRELFVTKKFRMTK